MGLLILGTCWCRPGFYLASFLPTASVQLNGKLGFYLSMLLINSGALWRLLFSFGSVMCVTFFRDLRAA